METGLTGCCIVAEELARTCWAIAGSYSATILSSVEQLLKFGNEEQRQRWLPEVATGKKLGAICITEPSIGSDAAGIESAAILEGDAYLLNGKKRFVTNAGVADIYCVYAKTSERDEDKAKHTQLSAFILEKGMKGFTVEKINELGGWVGLPTGYLNFDDVIVPVANRIGAEGDGWKILVYGLNFERGLFAASMLVAMRRPSEVYEYLVVEAQQVMGGDGWTKFYPVETFMRDARVNQLGVGTSEVMRMILYRHGLRAMADELKKPHRNIHPKLGVPVSTTKPQVVKEVNEKTLLEVLAEDYKVNPGLHMSRNHIKERFSNVSDDQLNPLLASLESKRLVKLYKDKRGSIALAKATYKGLKQAKPPEYYQWYPEWIEKDLLF